MVSGKNILDAYSLVIHTIQSFKIMIYPADFHFDAALNLAATRSVS